MNESPTPSLVRRTERRLARWPLQTAPPTVDQLRALSRQGQAAHVRTLFEALAPSDRRRAADPDVLRQVVLGSQARLRGLTVDRAVERQAELAFLEGVVQLFISECRARDQRPRDLFRTLLEWAREQRVASRLTDTAACCDTAAALGAQAFPDIWPWIQLEHARVLMLLGDRDEACAVLERALSRRDRVADRQALVAMLDLLGTIALEKGRASQFTALLLERLRAFHTDADERRTVVALLQRVHRGGWRLVRTGAVPARDRLLWLVHRVCLGRADPRRPARLARARARVSHGVSYIDRYVLPRRSARVIDAPTGEPRTLVTRAMGGIGDFLMMTPGLRERARRDGPLALAIPRRFFPIFDLNPDVRLLDIDGPLDPDAYPVWLNLTDCPAARLESRTAPDVRVNRIGLFARGLGVTGARLREMDRRPHYVVTEPERQWAHAFVRDAFAASGAATVLPLVGVQRHTDEWYRDVPHMDDIVAALAADTRVVVLESAVPSSARANHPHVCYAPALPLRQAFALAAVCDVLVTPDSAFFHLAGALDQPCVGLFGPTDGRVRAHDYPHARVVDARATLACVPCWRNEQTACALTGLRSSACLADLDPRAIVREVRSLCRTAPVALAGEA